MNNFNTFRMLSKVRPPENVSDISGTHHAVSKPSETRVSERDLPPILDPPFHYGNIHTVTIGKIQHNTPGSTSITTIQNLNLIQFRI